MCDRSDQVVNFLGAHTPIDPPVFGPSAPEIGRIFFVLFDAGSASLTDERQKFREELSRGFCDLVKEIPCGILRPD